MHKPLMLLGVLAAAAACGGPATDRPAGADSTEVRDTLARARPAPAPAADSAPAAGDSMTPAPAFGTAGILARLDLLNLQALRTVRYGLTHGRNEMVRSLAWRLAGDHVAMRDEIRNVAKDAAVGLAVTDSAVTVPSDVLRRLRAVGDSARAPLVYLDELEALYDADVGTLRSVLIPAAYSADLRDLLIRYADILAEHQREVARLRADLAS